MGKLVSYGGIGTFQIHAARLVDISGILNTSPTGRHPTPDLLDFQSCHDTRFTGLWSKLQNARVEQPRLILNW